MAKNQSKKKRGLKKYDIVPLVLLIYLGVMVWLGYPDYVAGATSPLLYFGGTAFTLVVIIFLRYSLKKRAQYRSERMAEMEKYTKNENESKKSDEKGSDT